MPTRLKHLLRKLLWILQRGRLVPWVLTLAGIILSGVMWYSLSANEDSLIREKSTAIATNIKREVQSHFADELAGLGPMVKRWEVRGSTPRSEWERDAAGYIENFSGFRAIAIIGPNLVARWQVPGNAPGNANNTAGAPEFRINANSKRHYQRAKKNRQITVFEAVNHGSDDHYITAVEPILKDGKIDGFVAAKILSRSLLRDAIPAGRQSIHCRRSRHRPRPADRQITDGTA